MIFRILVATAIATLTGTLAMLAGFVTPFLALAIFAFAAFVAIQEPQALGAAVMALFYFGVPAAIVSGAIAGPVIGTIVSVAAFVYAFVKTTD